MYQYRHSLLCYQLIFALLLLASGCHLAPPRQTSFQVQPDQSDFINFAFGGGEMGADATYLAIQGDGHVTYSYSLPYSYSGPQEPITREHQLAKTELQTLFQSLVDAGLFDLKSRQTQGADVPRTSIQASIDNHELDVAFDGTPDEMIYHHISRLIKTIHPAAGCFLFELADGFPLIELGALQAEVTLCLGEPAEVQLYSLPTEPFSGPAEVLVTLLEPGTPVEEWIYHDDDTSYYFWFASTTGQAGETWRLVEKATYPKGAVF